MEKRERRENGKARRTENTKQRDKLVNWKAGNDETLWKQDKREDGKASKREIVGTGDTVILKKEN